MAERLMQYHVAVIGRMEMDKSMKTAVAYDPHGKRMPFELNGHTVVNHVDCGSERNSFFSRLNEKDTLYLLPASGTGTALVFAEKRRTLNLGFAEVPLPGRKEMHVLLSTHIKLPPEGRMK